MHRLQVHYNTEEVCAELRAAVAQASRDSEGRMPARTLLRLEQAAQWAVDWMVAESGACTEAERELIEVNRDLEATTDALRRLAPRH